MRLNDSHAEFTRAGGTRRSRRYRRVCRQSAIPLVDGHAARAQRPSLRRRVASSAFPIVRRTPHSVARTAALERWAAIARLTAERRSSGARRPCANELFTLWRAPPSRHRRDTQSSNLRPFAAFGACTGAHATSVRRPQHAGAILALRWHGGCLREGGERRDLVESSGFVLR